MDGLTRMRGNLILESQVWEDAEILLHHGEIVEVNPKAFYAQYDYHFSSELIAPGLIDTHIHGAKGHDVMDATEDAVRAISRHLLTQGTTSFLATTMSASHPHLLQTLTAVNHAMNNPRPDGARVLGIHMEGPYVNVQQCGAQNPRFLRYPSLEELQRYLDAATIRMMTLAPELPGFEEACNLCRQQGVVVSLGHTAASFEDMQHAFGAANHVTHLFNGMPPMHHRQPGPAGASLLAGDVICEMICDGIHVDPAWVALAHKVLGQRLVLVTDSMRAAGLPDGRYELGGQPVTVQDSAARIDDGHLAGSTLSLLQAVINFKRFTQCSWPEAVLAATLVPARFLGIDHVTGSIAVGKEADLMVFNPSHGRPVLTILKGRAVGPDLP